MDARKTLLLFAFASALPAGGGMVPLSEAPAPAEAIPSRSEPACWIAGTTPTVRGRFVVRPTDITNAVIGAAHLGTILSSIPATPVAFSNGVTLATRATNHADFATFPLSSAIPSVVSRSTDERWGWYVSELNGDSVGGFVGMNGPSVAYSILGAPVAPWVDGTLTNQNVRHGSGIFDCCAGPALGNESLDQYVSRMVDTSTYDEQHYSIYEQDIWGYWHSKTVTGGESTNAIPYTGTSVFR